MIQLEGWAASCPTSTAARRGACVRSAPTKFSSFAGVPAAGRRPSTVLASTGPNVSPNDTSKKMMIHPRTMKPVTEEEFRSMEARDKRASTSTSASVSSSTQRFSNIEYMQEYAELKSNMLASAAKTGGLVAAYIFFSSSLEATLGSVLGVAAGVLYLKGLQDYVDSLTGETKLPIMTANQISDFYIKAAAKLGAAWQQALLQKRLLVPVGFMAAASAWNAADLGNDIPLWSLGLGFITYKMGYFGVLYGEVKQLLIEGDTQVLKPSIPVRLKEDPEKMYDMYGREIK